MYRLGFSCCILPFLNNYILECNPCSVFIDRICLCCETLTQELPVPGLCLGDAVSSASPYPLPSLCQIPLSISSDIVCETSFGMVLASELVLTWLVPFLVTLVISRLKKCGKFRPQSTVRANSLLVLCYLPFQTCSSAFNPPSFKGS